MNSRIAIYVLFSFWINIYAGGGGSKLSKAPAKKPSVKKDRSVKRIEVQPQQIEAQAQQQEAAAEMYALQEQQRKLSASESSTMPETPITITLTPPPAPRISPALSPTQAVSSHHLPPSPTVTHSPIFIPRLEFGKIPIDG